MSELVTGCLHVVDFDVFVDFVSVKFKVVARICGNFIESIAFEGFKFFLSKLILESEEIKLLLHQLSDLSLNVLDLSMVRVSGLREAKEEIFLYFSCCSSNLSLFIHLPVYRLISSHFHILGLRDASDS